MASTQTTKHIHKFRRHKYKSGNITLFCALPDCSIKLNPALALGKRSLCWRCGEDFILTEYSIRLAKPHCEKCHKPKHTSTEVAENIAVLEMIKPASLAERLQQTLNQASPLQAEEEIEDEL